MPAVHLCLRKAHMFLRGVDEVAMFSRGAATEPRGVWICAPKLVRWKPYNLLTYRDAAPSRKPSDVASTGSRQKRNPEASGRYLPPVNILHLFLLPRRVFRGVLGGGDAGEEAPGPGEQQWRRHAGKRHAPQKLIMLLQHQDFPDFGVRSHVGTGHSGSVPGEYRTAGAQTHAARSPSCYCTVQWKAAAADFLLHSGLFWRAAVTETGCRTDVWLLVLVTWVKKNLKIIYDTDIRLISSEQKHQLAKLTKNVIQGQDPNPHFSFFLPVFHTCSLFHFHIYSHWLQINVFSCLSLSLSTWCQLN